MRSVLSGYRKYKDISLLILLFCCSGCSFGLLEGYRKSEQVTVTPVSWFKTDSDHVLMTTTIDMKKNHFSGIMVIKSLTDSGYRVVFMTEVGLKIFDLEFISGRPAHVYYFLDALDKKILVNTLTADLKLLLTFPEEGKKPDAYESSSELYMLKYKDKGKKDYYGISPHTGRPVYAYKVSMLSKKARINYYSGNGMQIDSIKLIHYHVDLQIGMHYINEISPDAAE